MASLCRGGGPYLTAVIVAQSRYSRLRAEFLPTIQPLLIKHCQNTGKPPYLQQRMQDLHIGTTLRICIKNSISAPFRKSSAVRQGCILVTALFCSATGWLMWQCISKLGSISVAARSQIAVMPMMQLFYGSS